MKKTLQNYCIAKIIKQVIQTQPKNDMRKRTLSTELKFPDSRSAANWTARNIPVATQPDHQLSDLRDMLISVYIEWYIRGNIVFSTVIKQVV